MAIKSTILKAELDISDMDRHHYESHALTLARHPSETDERLMVRLLAYALNAHEFLAFSDGIDSADDPALWQRDLTGIIEVWIDVGQPDEKRILKASGKADQVVVYAYGSSATSWWEQLAPKVERAKNLKVVQFTEASSLGKYAQKAMSFHCMIEEGHLWLTAGDDNFEVKMVTLRDDNE